MDKAIRSITVETPPDPNPDLSYLGELRTEPGPDDRTVETDGGRYFVAASAGNPEADYREFRRFASGLKGMIGVRAKAEVVVDGLILTFPSGGVWGVDDGVNPDYAAELAREEVDQIRDVLDTLGFDDTDGVTPEWAKHAMFSGEIDA